MMTFFLIFALQCLFPIFDLSSGEWIGISTVNTDPQPREFTVTAISADGITTQTGRFLLGAGAQRANLLREIFLGTSGTTSPQSGWIRVDSALQSCSSYMAAGTEDTLAGAEAASAGTVVLLPHISVNTGFMELNHTDTQILVVNPNTTLANVLLQLVAQDGAQRGTFPLNVPGGGSKVVRVSEVFANILPNNNAGGKSFQGHVRATSNVSIAAWQRVETPLTRSMLRGRTGSDIAPTTQVIVSHFVFDGTYRSTLNVINPTGSPVSLEMTAGGNAGQNLGEVRNITLAPGEALRGPVDAIFRIPVVAIFPPPTIEGHVRIRQAQGGTFQIVGDIEISSDMSSTMLPLNDTSATRWVIPLAIGATPWATSYVLANPNELLTVQTDIQVEEVGSDGIVVRRSSISLSPKSRRVGSVGSTLTGGYLRFTSTLPFVVAGSIGTVDGRMVDQVPGLR